MGLNEDDKEKLKTYVGPSLKQTFLSNYFPNGNHYKEAIKHYRKYYSEKGIYENNLYPGIVEVLENIKKQDGKIALSTAKPTYFAKIILNYFKINTYFDVVVGSHLGGTRTDKKEIIFETLDQEVHCQTIVMSIGVAYGYAPTGELEAVNPDYIVGHPKEIINVLP